jgi:hypothetical protein
LIFFPKYIHIEKKENTLLEDNEPGCILRENSFKSDHIGKVKPGMHSFHNISIVTAAGINALKYLQ